jgi:WD40 repeat protein
MKSQRPIVFSLLVTAGAFVGLAAIGVNQCTPSSQVPLLEKESPGDSGAARPSDKLPEDALARLGSSRFQYEPTYSVGTCRPIAISPTGKILAVPTYDFGFCLFDADDGRLLRHIRVPLHRGHMVFSADGRTLVTDGLGVIDVGTGKVIRTLKSQTNQKIQSIALSPDGRTALAGENTGNLPAVLVFDIATGKELHRLESETAEEFAVAFAADGKSFVVGGSDKTLRQVDLATGKELRRYDGHHLGVQHVAFSPDGKTLLSAENKTLREMLRQGGDSTSTIYLWNFVTGELIRKLKCEDAFLAPVVFSPDGSRLAATGTRGVIRIWNVATGREVRSWRAHQSASSVAFTPDGKYLYSVGMGEGAIRRWDATTGTEVAPAAGHRLEVSLLQFAPDGKTLLSHSSDKTLEWDVSLRKVRRQLLARSSTQRAKGNGVIVSPDGKWLASVGNGGIEVSDAESHKPARFIKSRGPFTFSPDSRLLAFVGEDFTIRCADVATGQELRQWSNPQLNVRSLTFSPDGKALVSLGGEMSRGNPSAADGVRVWESATGKLLARLDNVVRRNVTSLAFSPSGRILAVGMWASLDVDVYTIELWEVLTSQRIRSFPSPHSRVDSLAFSPDARTLASGGRDSTIVLWDLTYRQSNSKAKLATQDTNFERLWADLAGDAATADQAIWKLTLAPDSILAQLKARVHSVVKPNPKQVAKLIADLSSEEFALRTKATKALYELGDGVERAMREAQKAFPTLEASRRLAQILKKLEADQTGMEKEIVRKLRAIDALEQMGTPEARRFLEVLAKETPNARVEEAAAAAQRRDSGLPKAD